MRNIFYDNCDRLIHKLAICSILYVSHSALAFDKIAMTTEMMRMILFICVVIVLMFVRFQNFQGCGYSFNLDKNSTKLRNVLVHKPIYRKYFVKMPYQYLENTYNENTLPLLASDESFFRNVKWHRQIESIRGLIALLRRKEPSLE